MRALGRVVRSTIIRVRRACLVRSSRIVHQKIFTVLIGHSALTRAGIVSFLHNSIYKIVAGVSSTSDLRSVRFPTDRCNLVIFSIGANGHYDEVNASIRFLRSAFSDCKVVVIAADGIQIDFARILSTAADSFILHIDSRDVLLKSLDLALLDQQTFVLRQYPKPLIFGVKSVAWNNMANGTASSGSASERVSVAIASVVDPLLSARERQVLDLLVQGKANKTIARECSIAEATVKFHVKAILRNINVRNRTEAAVWAIAHGYGSGRRVETIVANEAARTLQRVENRAAAGHRQGLSGVSNGQGLIRPSRSGRPA